MERICFYECQFFLNELFTYSEEYQKDGTVELSENLPIHLNTPLEKGTKVKWQSCFPRKCICLSIYQDLATSVTQEGFSLAYLVT